jgi:heat shock protein HtpX
MSFMKRLALFVLTNLLVMAMIAVVLGVLMAFIPALRGPGYGQLLVISSVVGFAGAFLSLALSKVMAKWGQGVKVIDPATASGDARWLIDTVYRLAKQAGITDMPEVGIWESDEINAFCTGPGKNSSLVAVSTGILRRMNRDELEGVLAHELSHASNGDMVTMTLVQGVVNTFVFFLSFIVTNILANAIQGNRDRDDRGPSFLDFFLRQIIFQLVQLLIGLGAYLLIIAPFSRWREFRADAGGAKLAGRDKMVAALEALQDSFRLPQPPVDPSMAAMKISAGKKASLFSTHPSLEERIEALRKLPG